MRNVTNSEELEGSPEEQEWEDWQWDEYDDAILCRRDGGIYVSGHFRYKNGTKIGYVSGYCRHKMKEKRMK